jgi:hypothetical protein
MKIEAGKYYRTRGGDVVGPMNLADGRRRYPWITKKDSWTTEGEFSLEGEHIYDLISEVYVSDTPPSDDVMLNLSEIARTKIKAMGEGNFGMDENPPCGIRLRWLVEVVDRPHDTLLNVPTPPVDAPAPETKTLRDEFAMRLMDRDMFAVGFIDEAEQLYRVADAMMEARKK